MTGYDRLRDYLRGCIAEHKARLGESTERTVRTLADVIRDQPLEAGRRIAQRYRDLITIDTALLEAVDRVEAADAQAEKDRAAERAAMLKALRDDTLPTLGELAGNLLTRLGERYPQDGKVLSGADLGAHMRDRGKPVDEMDLEILRAAARSKRSFGGPVKFDAKEFLEAYEQPAQPVEVTRARWSRIAHV